MATTGERAPGTGAVWALTALTALAGYLWIVAPANRSVADERTRLRVLLETGDRDEALVRRADVPVAGPTHALPPSLLARRSDAETTLAALQAFARDSARYHVTIAGFAPSSAPVRSHGGRQDVGVDLRGRYADVLQTVAAFSAGPVLFEVRGLTLAQTFDQIGSSGVDAALDGALFSSPADISDSAKERPPMNVSSLSMLRVAQDPFAIPQAPPPQSPASLPVPGLAALPPNAGAGVPVLRAVIDGVPPRALVEIGDRPVIVRIGSHLGFSTVTGIADGEVRLDDGRVLRLTGTQP